MWAGPADLPIDGYRSQLAALEVEKKQLEEDLAGRSEIYSAAMHSREVDAERVANTLEADSVLVEYVVFRMINLQPRGSEARWGAYRYLAFVLPAG
jgi:hypothetical protein